MSPDALASELVRALRGRRSQGALNRRLGRTSNTAHTWERGRRTPSTSDFFRMVQLAGVNVDAALARFGPRPERSVREAGTRRALAPWLEALARPMSRLELARKIGRDRNTVARWLDGRTEPRLPDLLRFVAVTTQRLLDFVAAFVDPEQLPSLHAAYTDLALQRRVAYELPWAHAVLRLLELDAYRALSKHERGFVAARIGISLDDEDECLEALARAGQIKKRRGKWALRRVLTVDTQQDPAKNVLLKRHWASVALARLDARGLPEGSLYSYNLFAISEEGLDAIRAAHLEYFERVRSIVGECKRPTRLALTNVQLVALDV
jgi:transcriptional regulator with XRE-family HTH domain